MKKPEITKGEWVLDNNSLHVCASNNKSGIIADVFGRDRHGKANARAISAVPEMIDALMAVNYAVENCKANSGAVYLGDKVEFEIKEALRKAGCE